MSYVASCLCRFEKLHWPMCGDGLHKDLHRIETNQFLPLGSAKRSCGWGTLSSAPGRDGRNMQKLWIGLRLEGGLECLAWKSPQSMVFTTDYLKASGFYVPNLRDNQEIKSNVQLPEGHTLNSFCKAHWGNNMVRSESPTSMSSCLAHNQQVDMTENWHGISTTPRFVVAQMLLD